MTRCNRYLLLSAVCFLPIAVAPLPAAAVDGPSPAVQVTLQGAYGNGPYYTGTVNGDVGATMRFTASANDKDTRNGVQVDDSINPNTWRWSFGDGSTAGPGGGVGASINHVYSNTGVYTVTVTVEDSGGPEKDPSPGVAVIVVRIIGGDVVSDADRLPLYAQDSPSVVFRLTAGQPVGTSVQWSISKGSDKARITGSASGQASVTLQATEPSAARDDITVSCTISLGDPGGTVTVHASRNTYSVRPMHVDHKEGALRRPWEQRPSSPPELHFWRDIVLTFLDQFGDPLEAGWPVSGVWVTLQGAGVEHGGYCTNSTGSVTIRWSNTTRRPGHSPHPIFHGKLTIRCGNWIIGRENAVDRKDYDTPNIVSDWSGLR